MSKTTTVLDSMPVGQPVEDSTDPDVVQFRENFDAPSPLDGLVREGARRMLQQAIEAEVDEFLVRHDERRDEAGRRLVVRNGSLPQREILTGAGKLAVRQPRVRDKSPDKDHRVTFSPSVIFCPRRRYRRSSGWQFGKT